MDYLNDRRATLEISKTMSQSERSRFRGSTYDNAMMMLSYQSGQYMTLPGEEYRTLKEWVYQYFRTGTAPLPYHGEIPDGNYEFTIEIIDTKKENNLPIHITKKLPEHLDVPMMA